MGKDNAVAPEEPPAAEEEGGGDAGGDDDANDPENENADVDDFSAVKRSCHDIPFCCLFLAFWVGMLIVFWTGVKAGQPEKLLYGTDYEGNVCGVDNSGNPPDGFNGDPADLDFTNKPLLYFPILGQNIDLQAPQNTVMFGICVETCPTEMSYFDKCSCLSSGIVSATHNIGQGMIPSFCFDFAQQYEGDPSAPKTAVMGSNLPPALQGQPHDCICKNDYSKCYEVSFPTKEMMYRCIPWSDKNETVALSCTDANGNDVAIDSNDCRTILQETNSVQRKPKIELPIVEQLQGFATTAGMMVNDVSLTWRLIIGIGGGVAVFAGFTWLFLMKMFAGIVVWATIIALICMELVGTFTLAMKSGILTMNDLNKAAELACEKDPNACFDPAETAAQLEQQGGTSAADKKNLEYAFYAVAGITVATILIVIVKRKAIQIAVGIIKEASDAIKKMPLLIAFPLLPFTIIMVVFGYFVVGAAFIYTSDNVSFDDLSDTLGDVGNATSGFADAALDAAGVNATALQEQAAAAQAAARAELDAQAAANGVNLTSLAEQAQAELDRQAAAAAAAAAAHRNATGNSTADAAVAALLSGNLAQKAMLAYHLFGFLWTNQLLMAVTMMTIAGAVCSWYWVLDKDDMQRLPIISALWRTFRYSIGSCAFGGLIIAFVQFLRYVLAYIDSKTQKLQDKNKFFKILMKVLACILWCFEKVVKFISKNAYIMVAMKGYSFCKAAKKSFMLVLANLAQIAMVSIISAYLILMGKLAITIGCTAMIYGILDSAVELGFPYVFTEAELTCCCNNGCDDLEDATTCGSTPGCVWTDDLLQGAQYCEEAHYNDKSSCDAAGICSNVAFNDDVAGCYGAGVCSGHSGPNAFSSEAACVSEGECISLPTRQWGTCAKCEEDAATSVAEDKQACEAVTALTTSTACDGVKLYSDDVTPACKYIVDCVPIGSGATCADDRAMLIEAEARAEAVAAPYCPLGDFDYSAPAWFCADDAAGALAAIGTDCDKLLQVAAMLNLGGCEVDINSLQRSIPQGTLISHACPRTCDACQLSCEMNLGTWVQNTWASEGNTFTPAVWAWEERTLMTSPILPTVLTCLIAWVTSSIFMFVYSMAIDTILLCFCEDKTSNDGSPERPYFMSPRLQKFIGAQKRKGGGGGDVAKP